MGIFSRIGEIVNANINAMLDKAEDPIKMVRLMIHEMEDTLMEIKSSAAEVIADQKRLQRKIKAEKARRDDWADKAQLALNKGREDLAREALERKLAATSAISHMEERLNEIGALADHYREDIGRLEDKLQNAKRRQKSLHDARLKAESRKKVEEKIYRGHQSGAFSRFEDYERRIDLMEAEADLMQHQGKALEKKFEDMERAQAIEDELEQLKKKSDE